MLMFLTIVFVAHAVSSAVGDVLTWLLDTGDGDQSAVGSDDMPLCAHAHTWTDTYTIDDNIFSAIHSIHLVEIIASVVILRATMTSSS